MRDRAADQRVDPVIDDRPLDLAAARVFYGHDLGFAEPFTISSGAIFKVNDHQYIEVYSTLKDDEDRLIRIAFETTNAEGDVLIKDGLAEIAE